MSFARNLFDKYGKKLLDTASKTGYAVKIASEKVVHNTAAATGELIGNKIAEKIVKSKAVLDVNLRNVEEIIEKQQKHFFRFIKCNRINLR